MVQKQPVHSWKEVLVQLEEVVQRREEGIMIKDAGAEYHPGERPPSVWMKVKPDQQDSCLNDTLDLLILGGYWGTKFNKNHVSHFLLGVCERNSLTGSIERLELLGGVFPAWHGLQST